MKKFLKTSLAASFLSIVCLTAAQASTYSQYSLSLDLTGQGAFGSNANLGFAGGVGASAFGDWRPIEYISFGTGLSFTDFPGAKSWQVASWDVGGRLFPFGAGSNSEWYLQGGMGYNFVSHDLTSSTPGNFHANAMVGYRAFVLGPGMALDLGLKYDFYTPLLYLPPLHDVGVKAGLTWFFGNTQSGSTAKASDKKTKIAAQNRKISVKGSGTGSKTEALKTETLAGQLQAVQYRVQKGDTLWNIAGNKLKAHYQWPLIFQSNKETINNPNLIYPEQELHILGKYPAEEVQKIRDMANSKENL